MPGATQPLGAAARDAARIAHRDDDARDPAAMIASAHGGVLPIVRARLERHVERRAARAIAGRAQRVDFGVRVAVARVKSFADDLAVGNDDGADHRVRRRLSPAVLGERERAPHVDRIELGRRARRAASADSVIYQLKRRPSEP